MNRVHSFWCVMLALCVAAVAPGCSRTDDGKVRIGIVASLTGPAGEQGKNWVQGAELAVDDLAGAGVGVRLFIEDDQTEPAKSASAFHKLASLNRVQGIVGGTWDYLAETLAPLALQYKIPTITSTNPFEVLSESTRANPFFFTNSMSLAAAGRALEEFVSAERIASMGLVFPNLPFGSAHASMVKKLASDRGIPVTFEYEFPATALMADNVRLAALRIQEHAPQMVFAVLDYNGLDLLSSEMRRLGSTTLVMTTQHLDRAIEFSQDASRYRDFFAIYPLVNEEGFRERFRAKHGSDPRVFAAHGYDAVRFLVEAIRQGVNVSDSQASLRYDGITGVHSIPGLTRELVVSQAVVMTARDGTWTRWAPDPPR